VKRKEVSEKQNQTGGLGENIICHASLVNKNVGLNKDPFPKSREGGGGLGAGVLEQNDETC